MGYILKAEIEARDIPQATPEDWDNNFNESYNREQVAIEAAANAVQQVWPAASEAAMLALAAAKVGHVAKRSDTETVYTLKALPATNLANWELTGRYGLTVEIENIDGLQDVLDTKPTLEDGLIKLENLGDNSRPTITNVADIDARDALTPKKGDKAKVASNVGLYEWNGAAWVFLCYYQVGNGQISGLLGQDKITNLIDDLAAINAALTAVSGGIIQAKYEVEFNDLAGAPGLTRLFNILPLGPLHTLHGCRVYTETAFASSGNTLLNSRVFYDGVDLLGAGGSMTSPSHRVSNTMLAGSVLGGDSVELELATDVDITDFTTGKLVVWIYYSINQ